MVGRSAEAIYGTRIGMQRAAQEVLSPNPSVNPKEITVYILYTYSFTKKAQKMSTRMTMNQIYQAAAAAMARAINQDLTFLAEPIQ